MTDTRQKNKDKSVLSRWSRRKREAEQARTEPESAPETAQPPVRKTTVASAESDAPPLTDADMPDIETLTEESDFSVFMSPGVTDELRNLALRKLFHAPVFNIRDGLDEYDDDFTTFEKLGDVVTADMKHQLEMQQQKLREKLAQEQQEETRAAAVDEAPASDYTGDPEDDVEDDFDDEPSESAAATDTQANRTERST